MRSIEDAIKRINDELDARCEAEDDVYDQFDLGLDHGYSAGLARALEILEELRND